MATSVISAGLNAAQLGVTLSGVPFAPGCVMAVQFIYTACSQVAVHKEKSAQLTKRCTSLLNTLNEQAPLLVGTEATVALDEAEAVLSSVQRRIEKWTTCGKVKRFLKSAQIARDLDRCCSEVDTAMEHLKVTHPVTMIRMHQQSMDMIQQQQATLEELLISRREVERAVQQHLSGGNAARELMRVGQERLIGLRGTVSDPSTTMLSDGRQIDESPHSSRPPSPITTVQNQIEQALSDLQRLTNIPPTIPILNNQIKMTNLASVRSGLYTQVFEGRWLGEKKVALKTTRVLDQHDPRNKRLQLRFEHEITIWSKLKHENVLTLLGIVTNMDPAVYIVSPWQLDHVRNYRHENPDVNPLKLLSQAARGLEYLHDQQIVHGNLKCTNMLVSEEGIVTLSDFGLTQVLTDVVGKATLVGLSNTSAVRWHAPEINMGEEAMPTMATDIFAFGMSVLELLTMKKPYSHRRRDISVVQDLMGGLLPPRPEEPDAVPWMSDMLWEMLLMCWKHDPAERMLTRELSPHLDQVSELATNLARSNVA